MAKKRNAEREDKAQVKVQAVSSKRGSKKKKSSSKVTGKGKKKATRTEAQKAAARRNAAKAREAKKNYAQLRATGFTRDTIVMATDTIQKILTSSAMRIDKNPAVARLMEEIGTYKNEEEIAEMTKAEYYKYATSIRTFLGSPLSTEEAAKYLELSFKKDMLRESLLQSSAERRDAYRIRRQDFIRSNETVSSQIFELYRRIMERNAGQIIKAKVNPAAYGSDNLIVDLFDFYESGQWVDGNMDAAVNYWASIIEEQEMLIQERARAFGTKAALEIDKFDWRGVETYASFIQR